MDIVDRSWEVQRQLEEKAKRLGKGRYGRILKMARKPTSDEYTKIVQVTGLGILIVGGIGFLIFFLMQEMPKLLAPFFPR
jgi:protein transport protein SEC61 subunit gamma-like protein